MALLLDALMSLSHVNSASAFDAISKDGSVPFRHIAECRPNGPKQRRRRLGRRELCNGVEQSSLTHR